MIDSILLSIHLLTTTLMTGVIWVIQLVHYPSFHYVDREHFSAFETFHSKQISKIVIPLMLLELVSGIGLLYYLKKSQSLLLINLLLLTATWLTTFAFSARYHGILTSGFSEKHIFKLIHTNWIRTLLWSIRTIIILSLFSTLDSLTFS